MESYLKKLKTIFIRTLLITLSIAALICVFAYINPRPPMLRGEMTLLVSMFMILCLLVFAVIFGKRQYTTKLKKIQQEPVFEEKLKLYQKSNLMRWYFYASAVFISSLAYFLTQDYNFLIFVLLLLLLLLLAMPTAAKVRYELALSKEEINNFYNQ